MIDTLIVLAVISAWVGLGFGIVCLILKQYPDSSYQDDFDRPLIQGFQIVLWPVGAVYYLILTAQAYQDRLERRRKQAAKAASEPPAGDWRQERERGGQ